MQLSNFAFKVSLCKESKTSIELEITYNYQNNDFLKKINQGYLKELVQSIV